MLKQIKNRPLLFFVMSFFVGMIFASILSASFKTVFVGVLLLAVFAAAVARSKEPISKARNIALSIPLLTALICGTVFQHIAVDTPKKEAASLNGSEKEIIAVVESVSYRSDYFTAYTVRVVELNGEKAGFNCALSIPYDIDAEENDVIRLNVAFSLPEKENYGFSLREYYSTRGIYILAEATDENARVIGFDRSIPSFFRTVSKKISVRLITSLGRDQGGFVSGLLIGRKDDIPDSVTTSFRYLGISHILSVSGLHLAVLTGMLIMILRAFTLGPKARYLCTVAFIISFILLTGARPAVIRSGIMLILMMSAEIFGRDYDPITALSASAFVIILLSPSSLYDAGFILSVSATAGIILLGAPITKWLYHISDGKGVLLRLFTHFLSAISITASASIFTLPAIHYFFGETSSVSILSNLLFIPLTTALMYLSILFLLFSNTVLSPSFAGMTASLSKLITDLATDLKQILPPPIDLTYPFTVIAITAGFGVLIYFLSKNKRALALTISAIVFVSSYYACLLHYSNIHKGEENVIFSTVGGNDYVIVNSDGKTLLCDFSSGSYSQINRASSLVQPQLHDTSIDTVLLTHLHRKHIDMISRMCDNNRISQIYIPSPQNEDETVFAAAISDAARERGVKIVTYNSDRDVTFDFEGIKITLCQRSYIERSVQPLHLMKIDGKRDFLYIGSAVFESHLSEKALSFLKSTDVLFLGSHGPLIKEPLPILNFDGETVIANSELNESYGTQFATIGFFEKYITQ